MRHYWLGLGSNIGDRVLHISNALEALGEFLEKLVQAPLYETAAVDFLRQDDFINTVIRGETLLDPPEVIQFIKRIELAGGRDRGSVPAKGPRTIDIDILLCDTEQRTWNAGTDSEITIPHESMHKRLFVLKPLIDLEPLSVDPRDGIRWKEKASHLSGQRVKLYRL